MKNWIQNLSAGLFGVALTLFVSSGVFSSDPIIIQINRSTLAILLLFVIYVFRVEFELSQLRKRSRAVVIVE